MKREPVCFGSVPGCGYFNDEEASQNPHQKRDKSRNESVPKPGVTVQVSGNPGCKSADSAETSPGGCDWCGPGRIGWFSVQFWVRSCYGKRKWMSVTQQYKHQVKYCPMCGRKLEVEE